VAYVPTPQLTQILANVAPEAVAYVPAEQDIQVEILEAPTDAE
jgi:signal transduction histidine kinase